MKNPTEKRKRLEYEKCNRLYNRQMKTFVACTKFCVFVPIRKNLKHYYSQNIVTSLLDGALSHRGVFSIVCMSKDRAWRPLRQGSTFTYSSL